LIFLIAEQSGGGRGRQESPAGGNIPKFFKKGEKGEKRKGEKTKVERGLWPTWVNKGGGSGYPLLWWGEVIILLKRKEKSRAAETSEREVNWWGVPGWMGGGGRKQNRE